MENSERDGNTRPPDLAVEKSVALFFFFLHVQCINTHTHMYAAAAAAAAALLQSCPTLCDPIDGSPPGSAILGILQARTLEWVAISFSNA